MVSFGKFMINQERIIGMPIKYLEGVLEKNAKLTDFMVFGKEKVTLYFFLSFAIVFLIAIFFCFFIVYISI